MIDSGWFRYLPVEANLVAVLAAANRSSQVDEFDDLVIDDPLDLDPARDPDGEYVPRIRHELARFAEAVGMADIATMGHLVELMRRHAVLVNDADGRLVLADPIPLVQDTGLLDAGEVANEDRIRWLSLYEPIEQAIIAEFVHEERDEWTLTMRDLAQFVDVVVQDAREGVAVLIESEEFTATTDPLTVAESDPFTIRVDWVLFGHNRINLGGFTGEDGPSE